MSEANVDIIGHKKIFLTVSSVLVSASLILLVVFGLNLGIDFTGGSLLEVEFTESRPTPTQLRGALARPPFEHAVLQPTGERGLLLRLQSLSEAEHQELLDVLAKVSGNSVVEFRFDSIGPIIGQELKQKSFIALGLTISAIILYIAWAFRRVSRPVSSWKYGVIAVVALIHDISLPTGIFVLLGVFQGVEVGVLFITALLTIMGFSVHDTIVVFDRIRENLGARKVSEPFEQIVNRSINQVIIRSINTSFTTLLVLIAIFVFGGETTRYFALTLALGIFFGTYSSLFIASPLLVWWEQVGHRLTRER